MGGVSSRHKVISTSLVSVVDSDHNSLSPCHKALLTAAVLHRIFRYALQNPSSSTRFPSNHFLSTSEACRLRQVCRLWNQEILSTFFWLRQPLLHISLSCRGTSDEGATSLQNFLEGLGLHEDTLDNAHSLPPFALTLNHFILNSESHTQQIQRTLEALLVDLDGASVLIQLKLKDFVVIDNGPLITLPRIPINLEFPVLQKITVVLSRIRDPGHALKLTTFLQQIVDVSWTLCEFKFKAVQWPAEIVKLHFPPMKLQRLELVDTQLPLGEHGQLNKLTSLTVSSTEQARDFETELKETLNGCRRSLEHLQLSNVHGQQALELNLASWPVMTSLRAFQVSRGILVDNPLDSGTRREIRSKFPALEIFLEEGRSVPIPLNQIEQEMQFEVPPGFELIGRLEELLQILAVIGVLNFYVSGDREWKWDENVGLMRNVSGLLSDGIGLSTVALMGILAILMGRRLSRKIKVCLAILMLGLVFLALQTQN